MFRRLLAAIVIIAVTIALLVAAWPQLFGLQQTIGIAQLVSFRAACGLIALIAVVIALVVALANPRSRRLGSSLAAVLVVFGLLTAAVLGSRGFGNTVFHKKRATDITVVSWNTLGGAPGDGRIARLAIDSDADIVTLPETAKATADSVAAMMTAAGHPMVAHTVAFNQISMAKSTSVLISTALGRYSVDPKVGSTTTLPTLVMKPDDGRGPTIVAAHPVAPIIHEMANWRSDLHWLASTCTTGSVIIAGDFNSTLDHLAGLDKGVGLENGAGNALGRCADAALRSHNAAIGTWPTGAPALLGAPIDHVMATKDWTVTGMRVVQTLDDAGSDHRPIVVQLSRSDG